MDLLLYLKKEAIKNIMASRTVIVPHPKKEIPIGTFRSIVRQSGLTIGDFS